MNVSLNHEEVRSIPNGQMYQHPFPNRSTRRASERVGKQFNNRSMTRGRVAFMIGNFGGTNGLVHLHGVKCTQSSLRRAI